MVVCKYFIQGYCRNGGRCKFDHVDPYRGYDPPRNSDYSTERRQGTSILKAANSSFGRQEFTHSLQHGFVQPQQHGFGQHGFSQAHQQTFSQITQHGFTTTPEQSSFAQKSPGLKCNVQEMMQIVLRDIAHLEKGGQWQLSCYSPIKELPNMPGLEDYSPEELRWECYKALQNGSLPLCQVIVQQLYGNVAKLNNELKRKDTGYSIIDRYLRDSEQRVHSTTAEQPVSALTSPFGGSSNSTSAFSSPFFSSAESQAQQTQSPTNSFSFSLSLQQQPSSVPSLQQNSTVFSNNQKSAFASQGISSFSSPIPAAVVDGQAYSASEVLSEVELKAFQAERFVLGSIPTKPPPRALCSL